MSRLFASKFVRLIKTFPPEEIRAFEQWLHSPWCNSNKNLIRLFQQFKKYYPDFLPDRKLTKAQLFRQILPEGKFSDRRLNNLLSEGYRAAERFLVAQRFDMDSEAAQNLLADEFQERGLDDWFTKIAKREITDLEEHPTKEWKDHLSLYNWYRQIYHSSDSQTRMQAGNPTIHAMEGELDLLYALEKAAILNEKMSRQQVLRDESYEITSAISNWEALVQGICHPSIALYRLRFTYLGKDLWTVYQELHPQVVQQLPQLNAKEQKIHLLSLLNDSIRLVKSGHLDIVDLLPLYQLGLATGVLLNRGKLSRSTYTQIVMISNTKGDFAYTERFIDDYSGKLSEKGREDSQHWARAHTAYWRKDLEECLTILQGYTFKILYFQLITRSLQAQVLFDLYLMDDSYQFLLFNFLDTFEKWLQREKMLSQTNKISFLRFVQKCRTLATAYGAVDFQREIVAQLLSDQEYIQALNWLKKKQQEVLTIRSEK
ncbi:hypothetical protein [Flavilitoribacter nigricans]|uniref:Uncharacterized protein n=1 Tax=Flavilitoribacter nigricans (strain ATCC 23147 / DSM 23189 / NBRC 102662 / NCIMB 1420 / SS-2) TaxID=1122177 RepID=A0A2D0NGJ8_FLAN2|nr:hypothetical protein [Flavilitoribacter nigricans]PHN07615.1 hypothetical protein CRP01_05805 [Flavilitoribacter nigricans DSM 23189 = NBRC 102662]